MPLREYRCGTCHQVVEVFLHPRDTEPTLCGDACVHDRAPLGEGSLARLASALAPAVMGSTLAQRNPDNCASCGAPDSWSD